jgi:hypothetical protein
MKTINFKEFEVFTDISRKNKTKGDARESFANVLYRTCNGIAAHALALKIYESDGEIEINDQEAEMIRSAASAHCTPAFIDGVLAQLDN